jgi:hypothetical protein
MSVLRQSGRHAKTGIEAANIVPVYTTKYLITSMRNIIYSATAICAVAVAGLVQAQERKGAGDGTAALGKVSPHVAGPEEQERLRTQLSRSLREQIAAANRASSADWAKINSRESWEQFRREKLAALRDSLGDLQSRPAKPRSLVTGTIQRDGFQIQNLVFESRPGLVVTANLYVPRPARESMPAIVIAHSHHNPKEQGELQDMGMTWARAGCYVLVPDALGHGERRQHPFVAASDYPREFQLGRQDYYFRYDTSLQLYLLGESLLGWMAHDLMTGIDLLLAQPGVDAKKIILLGSVAGCRWRRPGQRHGCPGRAHHLRRPLQLWRPAARNALSAARQRGNNIQLFRRRKLGIDPQSPPLGCRRLPALGHRRQHRPTLSGPCPRVHLGPRARSGMEALSKSMGILRRDRQAGIYPRFRLDPRG